MATGTRTTALGALVKAVGEARKVAAYGMVGAAAFVASACLVDLVQVAHVDSIERMREAAVRIARMHADGTSPERTAYAFRDVARESLLKAFGGERVAAAATSPATATTRQELDVEFEGTAAAETEGLRDMVDRARATTGSVADRGELLAEALGASARVRSAMRHAVGEADGMTAELGSRVARLYALDAALESVQRAASSGDIAKVAEDPAVEAALRGPDRVVLASR